MSKRTYNFICPNCSTANSVTNIYLETPVVIKTWCSHCYYPLKTYPNESKTEIVEYSKIKTAFLVHSSDSKEKKILNYFRALLKLWGVETLMIENDARPVDWLQKSLDGISKTDFVLSFLTKRYQFADEKGTIVGWKAPDKCYDEIAIAFALQKQIIALVEKDVDSGNVLNTRAWCYNFSRTNDPQSMPPIKIEFDFFIQMFTVLAIENRNSL